MRAGGIFVTLGAQHKGLALGMYISCCLLPIPLPWEPDVNPVSNGIQAYNFGNIEYVILYLSEAAVMLARRTPWTPG